MSHDSHEAAVWAYIDAELRAKTGELLDRAERTLSAAWGDIRDDARQSATRAAARWLKDNKLAVQEAFYQRLMAAVSAAETTAVVDDTGLLNLVDDNTLNILVIRAQMVQKVLGRARVEIKAMETRLRTLIGRDSRFNVAALMPGRIADGYLQVLQGLGVPDDARAVLMEVYSERGVELLTHFYQGLNQLLVERGVLPYLGTGLSQPTPQDVSFTMVDDDGNSVFDLQFDLLQSRIEELPFSRWQPGVLTSMNLLPPTTVMTSMHEVAIERVETFFMDLLQDERISLRARNELSRMAASLLVLNFKEPAQLDSAKTPVNVFVKQLALLGMRDQESRIDNFERIGFVVGRIVAERGHNLESFRSGAQALYTIARTEVERRLAAHRQSREAESPPQG